MRFIVKWLPVFILGGAVLAGIAMNPGPEFGSLFPSSETKLNAELAKLTLPGAQIVNQAYDKGSGCRSACPSMAIEYRFTPTPVNRMESELNSQMQRIGYSRPPSQAPPYEWARGQYYVTDEWLAITDENKEATGHELTNQLLVRWTYKFRQ
jgi:hypothetical protein